MRVSAADHAELEWVHAQLGGQVQAEPKGRSGVGLPGRSDDVLRWLFRLGRHLCPGRRLGLRFRAGRRLGLRFRTGRPSSSGNPPRFEVRERIVRRHQRVRLAVSLDLRHFNNRFEPRPCPGVGRRQRPALVVARPEHLAAAEIAVVRDGDHVLTQPLFVVLKVRPKIFRVVAVETGERQCLSRQRRPVWVEDIPVDR